MIGVRDEEGKEGQERDGGREGERWRKGQGEIEHYSW